MTTPSAPSPNRRWELSTNWLVGLTTAVLLLVAASQLVFVIPSYYQAMKSMGVAVSLPARLALDLSHYGWLLVTVGAVLLGVAYWKDRRDRSGVMSIALAFASFLAAVYLAMVSMVYVDLARVMDRLH